MLVQYCKELHREALFQPTSSRYVLMTLQWQSKQQKKAVTVREGKVSGLMIADDFTGI